MISLRITNASVVVLLSLATLCNCFLSDVNNRIQQQHRPSFHSRNEAKSSLSLSKPTKKLQNSKIIKREGQHFLLDKFKGKVEFGTTADLITSFPSSSNINVSPSSLISKWLQNEKRVALSIWDPKLIKEIGDSRYRLQLMTLQFVTITLTPTVDVDMWTEVDENNKPIFYLESGNFNPNVQILPGISINSLDIQIKVVGTMEVSKDGKGVTGKIGFESSGVLPPPLRFLPESGVRKATELINNTVKRFAISSFQKGAVLEYRKFLKSEEMKIRMMNKEQGSEGI